MARPIDEKIVAMKMDNSDFKQKAVETTGLFGKLKDALNKIPGVNLGKTVQDLNGIQSAAGNTNLNGLSTAVQGVGRQFSAMSVIATTALATIVNKAVNAGTSLAKSLGMDQVTAGFQEYELKMGSIQTILANTSKHGTTLGDVKKNLEELNEYADKTIYNFGDMTKNIGLFTNAGLKLEESTSMIKGFSNAAAASGTNAEGASHAAYQLSQALSSGTVRLMDWRSLTNVGMGNKNMQEGLIDLATAMGEFSGTGIDGSDALDDFNKSLEKNWLSADVMSKYLQIMAKDMTASEMAALGLTDAQIKLFQEQANTAEESATKVRTFTQLMDTLREGIGSGWAVTWELIFGDFEEATRLWTAVSNLVGGIFQKQSDARNNFIQSLIDGDGLHNLITSLMNISKPIIQIFKAIGAGFKLAFPPIGISGIENIIKGLFNLTSNMTLSSKTVDNIKTIFAGFFSMFAIGWTIIKTAVSIILALIPSFSGLGSKIIELISKVAQIPIAFNNASGSGKAFGSAMEFLKSVASNVSSALEYIVSGLISFADTAAMAFGVLSKGDVSEGPWKDTKIVDWLLKIREGFKTVIDAVGSIDWAAVGSSFMNFFKSIKTGFEWIIDKATAVGTAIKNAMPDGNQILAGGFIAGLAAMVGMAIKMSMDLYKVFTGWGKIGGSVADMLDSVGGALEAFSMQVKAQALLTIAIAVGVLAGAFWILSTLDGDDISKGLYAIVGSLSAIVIAMAVMTKYDITGTGFGAAVQIVALSIAFAILAGAIKKMGNMNWNELAKGIFGLIGVMGTFSLAMIAMSKFSGPKVAASALQFVGLAIAMHILISAIEKIADIKPAVIVKGVATLATILLALGVFLAISAKSKFGAASALGILGIATAILLIVTAVRGLGEMDVEVLKQGLITITIILAAVAAFSMTSVGLLATGAGLLLLSVAMNLLMVPILALGSMDIVTLAKGLGAMAVALVAIGLASMLMTGMVAAGAGLILMAVGLNLLLIPILALSALSWGALTIGIVGLAGGILLIGGAAALLGLAAPALLLGAAGIALLGVAMLAAGLGMSLFGAGLVTLAGMTGTAVTTIIAMLGTLIMGLISLIPMFVNFVFELNMKILGAFEKYGPLIANKMFDIMIKVLDVLTKRVPEFAAAATDLMVAFLGSMEKEIPRLTEAASSMMVATIEALASAVETNGPKFIDAFNRLMAAVASIAVEAGVVMIKAIFGWIPGVNEAANAIGAAAEKQIRETFNADSAGSDKGVDFNNSLGGASGGSKLAGQKLALASEEGAKLADLAPVGASHSTEYSTGLLSAIESANTSGIALANSGKSGAGSVEMSSTGLNFTQGFAGGMSSSEAIGKVVSSAKSVAVAAYNAIRKRLDIRSPSRETDGLGVYTGRGFANGIAKTKGNVKTSANSIAGVVMNALGIKSAPAKEASKGGAATGNSYAKGVSSTKKAVSKSGKSTGKSYSKGVSKGISSNKKAVTKSAKDVAGDANKAFDEAMDVAEHKFKMGKINSSQYIAELEKIKRSYSKYPKLVREVESDIKKAQEDASKHKADLVKKGFDKQKAHISEQKYYNKLSLNDELKAWQSIQKKYKAGTEERKEADREVYRLKNDIVKQNFANEKKVLDDGKYYGTLSLAEELAAWQAIQKKYKVGTEERKEADREVYRLKNDLIKQAFSDEKKAIDEKKQYNELSTIEELEAWELLRKKYKEGTEERKEADREVYRLKNDINRKLIDMNKEYVDQVQNANKELIDSEKQLSDERDKLIKETNDKRISEEKRLTDEYESELKNRTNSLTNFAGIFERVTRKKMSGKQLLANMKSQFDTLTTWTEDFKKLSGRGLDEELIKTLREMGPKSANEIAALNTLTDEQLLEYSNIWKSKNSMAKVDATDQLKELRASTYSQIQQLQVDTSIQLQQINNDWYAKVEALRAQTAIQLDTYKTEWLTKIEELSKGTQDEFVKLEDSMTEIGTNTIKGMMDGMKLMEGPLMAQAKALADAVSSTIKGALKIKSPSKLTTGYGEDTGQGLVNGLANKVKAVASSAKDLAVAAKDSLNEFLEGFELPDGDNELHFKAVIDYEKVNVNGFGKLNLAPDTSFTTNVAEATRSYKRQNDNINRGETVKTPSVEPKSTVINQNLSFHSRQLSPSEVARKNIQASRQIAAQWGV